MPDTRNKKNKGKNKIITRGKSYSLNDSWLYNIKSKRVLCKKLKTSISKLNKLTDDNLNYKIFTIDGKKKKKRCIQSPNYKLDKIHSLIASYIARVKTPDYLHSGIKGRSHITNAKTHIGKIPVLTLDIRDFYRSTSQKSIFYFFLSKLNCSPDIAGIFSSLSTFNGHLPTGSRLSMVLAFWANQPMFECLHQLCKKNSITMTVYVDDLTFSGNRVNSIFKKNVINIIKKSGMYVHPQKTIIYAKNTIKTITGVTIKGSKSLVCNKHHKAIYEVFNSLKNVKNEDEFLKLRNKLIGQLSAAGQIDERFLQYSKNVKRRIN